MTDTINPTLRTVIDFALKIIRTGKTGSAPEAHEIKLLWDLGDSLKLYCAGRPLHIVLDSIEKEWSTSKYGKFDSRLYRGALTTRNYWTNREEYLNAIKSLNSWGKLREVVPLLDIVLKSDARLTRQDIDEFIGQAHNKTYTEVRDLVKVLRLKGDPIFEELGIDIYELQQQLYEITEELVKHLERKDNKFFSAFRQTFKEEYVLAVRKCLSGLQSEEVYQKYKKETTEFSRQVIPSIANPEIASLSKLIGEIARLTTSEAGRKKVREDVGIRLFGDLSTYLKALSSDKHHDSFLKKKEVLKTFVGGIQH